MKRARLDRVQLKKKEAVDPNSVDIKKPRGSVKVVKTLNFFKPPKVRTINLFLLQT